MGTAQNPALPGQLLQGSPGFPALHSPQLPVQQNLQLLVLRLVQ